MFDRDSAPKVLSEENLDAIHEHAMRILEEIGMDVIHEPARDLLAKEGQTVDGERVRFDRGWIAERVAQAPSSFTLRARNPERSVVIGGGTPVLTNVGGPPFCSDLDNGRRSEANLRPRAPGATHAGRPSVDLRTERRGGAGGAAGGDALPGHGLLGAALD